MASVSLHIIHVGILTRVTYVRNWVVSGTAAFAISLCPTTPILRYAVANALFDPADTLPAPPPFGGTATV